LLNVQVGQQLPQTLKKKEKAMKEKRTSEFWKRERE